MDFRKLFYLVTCCIFLSFHVVFSQALPCIILNKSDNTISLSDSARHLMLHLSYSNGIVIDRVIINNGNADTVKGKCYSGVVVGGQWFSSLNSNQVPTINVKDNQVVVSGIVFGNDTFLVKEEWTFQIDKDDIQWQIERQYLNNGTITRNFFPRWEFDSIGTWDGALLDNGGVAWNHLLPKSGNTFGNHAGSLILWNHTRNLCLEIQKKKVEGLFSSVTFRHEKGGGVSISQSSSYQYPETKNDLRRYTENGEDVFAALPVRSSKATINYTLKTSSYNRLFYRGDMKGISGTAVTEMLNTIGRYGVVDKDLFGSNGWRSGYVVLQEPWLALLGIAVDSKDFIDGYSKTLEYEKDHAVMKDGRVLPRWHQDASDAMPHTFRADGYYECQWGYMLDSQPAFVIDVADQFDLTGDISWLRKFKSTCEKVLGYMLKRDSDGNGLFEVMQDSYKDHKGCDWMDVVWASYEVASINAYMYQALSKWSSLELLLGDEKKSRLYKEMSNRLKRTFNKSTDRGGFWDNEKKYYVYWRQKDGSVYGDNLVSMVNFLAIGYGLCDDPNRKEAILQKMETLMKKENLFVWPSCFYPYSPGLGLKNVNYPYPRYENGDLFLAWAELGIRSYADQYPDIALKYVRNVISRYEKDGLAYQRYTRKDQQGAGDDILSNNIMAIVGLYRDIYGIQPRYNRIYLSPHLASELYGTTLKYWLRGKYYHIGLSKRNYSVSWSRYSVIAHHDFGVRFKDNGISYFNKDEEFPSLKIVSNQACKLDVQNWEPGKMKWSCVFEEDSGSPEQEVCCLLPEKVYYLSVNNGPRKKIFTDRKGCLHISPSDVKEKTTITFSLIKE